MRNKGFPKNHPGNAGVILIAILVLVGVVIGVQKYMKSHAPNPDTAMDLPIWKEWRIREKSEKPAVPISDKQVKIPGMVAYDMTARLKGTEDSRGELRISVSQESVFGIWSGTYSNDKKDNFDVQGGGFEGKVFPGKIYKDEKGQDPSKLYFLAKGKFMMHMTSANAKQLNIIGGDIYTRGWLNPDLSIDGELILTSDEKYSQVFTFKATRPEVKN